MNKERGPARRFDGDVREEAGTGGGPELGPMVAGGGRGAGEPIRGILAVARVVVVRPNFWAAALTQGLRLARPGWWRKWPPLPVPSDGLWHLRMLTAYGGDGSALPDPDDVTSYLDWCRTARQWHNR